MRVFKVKKKFDSDTGKELLPTLGPTNVALCDYTGEEIDLDNCEFLPQYQFETLYESGCEEVYYYDDEKSFFEGNLNVDYHTIFVAPFVFKVNEDDYGDNSLLLIKEWLDNVNVKGHIFYQCKTIEAAMRHARVRTVKRLLLEKKYTRDELGLDEYE